MHGDDSDSDDVYNDEGENDERFDVDGWSDFTWPSRTVAIFHPCLRQRLATGKDGIIKLGMLVLEDILDSVIVHKFRPNQMCKVHSSLI